ncbi:hypothetical protein PVAP13_3NG248994 [Panicum virgatum]|uniref:Uncharacterized protein n=1 Tax=Panicum virgatum TaxID=38727 RepID=A0A8T0U6G9_PANVG|nr:hypothetical protein PVAP13_3NG248994 [Panicum virgatum]
MCGSPVLSIHFFSPACSQQPYPFAPVARVFPIHPFLLSQRHLLGEHRREGGRRRFLGRAPARSRGGASWGEHRQGMRSVEGGWKTLAESQTLLRCLSTVPPSSSSSPSSSALFPPPLAPISSSHRRQLFCYRNRSNICHQFGQPLRQWIQWTRHSTSIQILTQAV